jgi:signal transduction histidine kinase
MTGRAHRLLLRSRRLTESSPPWRDVGLAVVLLSLSLVHGRRPVSAAVGFGVLLLVALPWRRAAPVVVFGWMWVAAALGALVVGPQFADSALLIGFYTVAATRDRRTTALVGAAFEVGIILVVFQQTAGADQWLRSFVALTGLATAAGVLGINVGSRRQILAGLRERANRLEQEREQELALAAATERSRIAREMHDVVAHNLSVMVALCDGAAYHVDDAPERVASALEQASRAGRQALAEMRQLLGVLHDRPAAPALAPQPGLRQVAELVDQVRAAGLPVTLTLTGDLDRAPRGLELAVYRIVQEALTNTLKHAGPGASASVAIACDPAEVIVEVADTGAGGTPGGDGSGLRGLRERAAVYEGRLEAGPRPHGGWRVRTTMRLPSDVAVAVS